MGAMGTGILESVSLLYLILSGVKHSKQMEAMKNTNIQALVSLKKCLQLKKKVVSAARLWKFLFTVSMYLILLYHF